MILAAIFPAALSVAIFAGTLRQRPTTRAEREAASVRIFDGERAAKTAIVVVLLGLGLFVVAALHLYLGATDLRPLELS